MKPVNPDQLFRYADRYARRQEKRGQGTQYPTFRKAAKRFNEDRVTGNLLRRLTENEGDDVAPAAGEMAGGGVRVVVECGRRVENQATGLLRDGDPRAAVQDEGDGGP